MLSAKTPLFLKKGTPPVTAQAFGMVMHIEKLSSHKLVLFNMLEQYPKDCVRLQTGFLNM